LLVWLQSRVGSWIRP